MDKKCAFKGGYFSHIDRWEVAILLCVVLNVRVVIHVIPLILNSLARAYAYVFIL